MVKDNNKNEDETASEVVLLSYYRSSHDYLEKLNRHTVEYYRFYTRLLQPEDKERFFLDVGCGSGEVALSLGARGYKGVGVDISPLFIEDARKKALTRGIKNIEFIVTNIDNLPFEDCTFSSCGAYEVFEHLYHPDKVIQEIARVLQPSGKIIIAAPNYLSPLNHIECPLDNVSFFRAVLDAVKKCFRKETYHNIYRIIRKEILKDSRLYFRDIGESQLTGRGGDEDAVFVCNPPDIMRMMEENGIQVRFFSSFGYRSAFFNDIINRIVNRIPIFRFMGWGTFVWGEKKILSSIENPDKAL